MTRAGEGQLSLFPPEPAPDPLLCWLWLAGTLGAGSQRAGAVLDAFGGAQEAWEARDTDAFAAAAGPAAVQRACLPDNTPEHYRAFARRCAARRIRILPYDDPDYPLAFSRISDMPLVLYCTGDPRWLNEPAAVGMVGTRKPTEYGLRAAEDIGRGLARAGAVIVSGLADGLDSASEYPPESEPVGAVGFLQRNRLIAALSGALVVVEAKEKSGTMSTVGHAERYGKPVFAVPGSIFSPASAGTNALLRDGRAKAVCTAADLFGTLGLQAARPAPAPRETPRPLSENERLVLSCLGAKAQGVEELGVKSGLPTAALLGVLMKLELAGRVSCLPGKRYILRGGSAS